MTLEEFFSVVERNEVEAVTCLTANPDLVTRSETAGDFQRGQPAPAIVHAAHRGLTRTVATLLDSGADITARGVDGGTALHVAAWIGHADTVGLLIARGAPLELPCTAYGGTPLLWAVHGDGPDGAHPKRDQVEAARLLLAEGANPDAPNADGHSPLDLARRTSDAAMAAVLINAGARADD